MFDIDLSKPIAHYKLYYDGVYGGEAICQLSRALDRRRFERPDRVRVSVTACYASWEEAAAAHPDSMMLRDGPLTDLVSGETFKSKAAFLKRYRRYLTMHDVDVMLREGVERCGFALYRSMVK